MPIARPERQDARVIAHVDLDCFYVQVEQRKQPDLRGLPTAVVQYNSWKGGGLIAVGYEARKFGVKRSMRGDEAKKVCPDIHLIQVPVARGKADMNLYRNAGSEVVSILATKGRCERASIDEVYLDLTDAAESMLLETPDLLEEIDEEVLKSHVLGVAHDEDDRTKTVKEWFCRNDADHEDKLLTCGAIIVARLRMEVLEETQFTCSAGIAHNKMLAKLASGMHKPAQQTVVPSSSVKDLLATLPVKKMKQLGGKLGSSLQSDLGANTIGDLLRFSGEKLQELYGMNTGSWLYNIARGVNGEEVEGRLLPKSHGCGKTFPGVQALKTTASVEHWLNQLCEELSERIQSDFDQNKRVAHTLTLHANAYMANDEDSWKKFPSKSCPLRYGTAKIKEDAKKLFDCALRDFLGSQSSRWRVTSLSVSASKILETPPGTCSILKFFQGKDRPSTSCNEYDEFARDDLPSTPSGSKSYVTESEHEKQRKIDCEAIGKVDAMFHQEEEEQQRKIDRKPTGKVDAMIHQDEQEQQRKIDHKPTGKVDAMIRQDITVRTSGKLDKISKDKGAGSILNFFKGSSSCSTNQSCDGSNKSHLPFPPENAIFGSIHETERKGWDIPAEGRNEEDTQNVPRGGTWPLNVEDIDPSVIDELPLEIQREVRGWLRPTKRPNTTKRGSTIADYFTPAKS